MRLKNKHAKQASVNPRKKRDCARRPMAKEDTTMLAESHYRQGQLHSFLDTQCVSPLCRHSRVKCHLSRSLELFRYLVAQYRTSPQAPGLLHIMCFLAQRFPRVQRGCQYISQSLRRLPSLGLARKRSRTTLLSFNVKQLKREIGNNNQVGYSF